MSQLPDYQLLIERLVFPLKKFSIWKGIRLDFCTTVLPRYDKVSCPWQSYHAALAVMSSSAFPAMCEIQSVYILYWMCSVYHAGFNMWGCRSYQRRPSNVLYFLRFVLVDGYRTDMTSRYSDYNNKSGNFLLPPHRLRWSEYIDSGIKK